MDSLLIFGGAVTAGLLAGFLGLGGGALLVPALSLFAGIPIKQAVGISLTSSIATSMAASTVFIRKDRCDLDTGMKLALAATVGGLSGAALSAYVSGAFLAFMFAAVLLYSGGSLALRSDNQPGAAQSHSHRAHAVFLVIAFLGGVMSGLLGVGGGIVFVPLMFLGMKLPIQRSVGTSAFIVGLTATAGAVIYFLRGELDSSLEILPAVVVGMIVGARLGGLLGVRAKSRVIRVIFAALLVYMSYRMITLGLEG
ncbi:MAG: sulfite exporter TauE/SafE family protein [Candidatus Zixiibacteriota bacterium]